MQKNNNREQGFTLVELITVLVILGVVGAVVSSRMSPQSTMQLQAGRDTLISAFFVAQQSAMAKNYRTQLSTSADQVDIRVDSNEDDIFSVAERLQFGGSSYPISLAGGVSLSTEQFIFDGLGHTSAGSVTVNKGANSVNVTVSSTGYAY